MAVQNDGKQGRLAALIRGEYDYTRPRRGEVREAVILSIGQNDILVDLGGKRDGIVPPKDLDYLDDEYRESLEVGDHVPVFIMRLGGREDGIQVSLNKGLQWKDWLRAQDLLDSGKIIEGEVSDFNRGGVLVPFGRVRGFVPNSHLTSIPPGLRGKRLREAKENLVGKTLPLVVIEVNQRRRRLVLSERVATRRRRQQLLDELTEGDVRTGVVRNLVDFGAFVDLGGMDGLIHISELDWRHVQHPREVLSVGDEVDVYVLDVDRERKRIALSRKRLLPDPWHQVTKNLYAGDEVEGTVSGVVDFGAFVNVGDGVDGLVHVSEMPKQEATLEELKVGLPVTVSILEIDEWQHQIALRLHDIGSPAEEETEEKPVEDSSDSDSSADVTLEADSDTEVEADADVDAEADVSADSATEVEADADVDAEADVSADSATEVEADADVDAEADVSADSATEVEADADEMVTQQDVDERSE